MNQFHFTPETYSECISDLPRYEELQEATAAATAGPEVREILELGTGTGETARRVLALQPHARLTGLDESAPMLERAMRFHLSRFESCASRGCRTRFPTGHSISC